MDTNAMYIEHYVDLHNYISDNIYELNDDIIFTESIWKKILIGGLAIGGIALIWKYHRQIWTAIQKLLGNKTNKAAKGLQELGNQIAKKSKEEAAKAEEEKPKNDEDSKKEEKPKNDEDFKKPDKEEDEDDANRRLRNIKKYNINKFKQSLDKNCNKLYIFKTIYENIKNNKLNEKEKFMMYYFTEENPRDDATLRRKGVFDDLDKIMAITTEKSIHNILKLDDKHNIFKILSNHTNEIEKTINKNQYKDNNIDLLYIIDNLQNLLLDAYSYITQTNKDMNYLYNNDDIFSDDATYYRFDMVKDMIEYGYKYNDTLMQLLMNKNRFYVIYTDENGKKQCETVYRFNDENLEHLLKEINNFKSSNKTEVKISEERQSRGSKYKFKNILTIIEYHKWFLKQLIDLSDTVNNLLS